MLAIRRGEDEKVLYFVIELDPLRPIHLIKSRVCTNSLATGRHISTWRRKTAGSAC